MSTYGGGGSRASEPPSKALPHEEKVARPSRGEASARGSAARAAAAVVRGPRRSLPGGALRRRTLAGLRACRAPSAPGSDLILVGIQPMGGRPARPGADQQARQGGSLSRQHGSTPCTFGLLVAMTLQALTQGANFLARRDGRRQLAVHDEGLRGVRRRVRPSLCKRWRTRMRPFHQASSTASTERSSRTPPRSAVLQQRGAGRAPQGFAACNGWRGCSPAVYDDGTSRSVPRSAAST